MKTVMKIAIIIAISFMTIEINPPSIGSDCSVSLYSIYINSGFNPNAISRDAVEYYQIKDNEVNDEANLHEIEVDRHIKRWQDWCNIDIGSDCYKRNEPVGNFDKLEK